MSRDDPPYARVSPRFWETARDEGWTDDMVILGLYLLTCPSRTTEGIFRLPRGYMLEDLPGNWTPQRLTQSLSHLSCKGFVQYDDKARVAFLPNAMKYQRPDNGNQQKSAIRNLRTLPDTRLLGDFREAAGVYCEAFAKALDEAFPQGFTKGYSDPLALALAPAQPPAKNSLADASAPAVANDEDFEHWWTAFGKVGSKADARELYSWWRAHGATADDLLRAATSYRAHCTATDCKLKHARTFLAKKPNRWREWADGESHGSMDVTDTSRLTDVLAAGAAAFGLTGGIGDDRTRQKRIGGGTAAGRETVGRRVPAFSLDECE